MGNRLTSGLLVPTHCGDLVAIWRTLQPSRETGSILKWTAPIPTGGFKAKSGISLAQRCSGLPAGTRFGTLASAIVEQGDTVARYLGQLAEFASRGFSALNTAFMNDGAFVHIPDGAVLEAPLQVLFVSTGGAGLFYCFAVN